MLLSDQVVELLGQLVDLLVDASDLKMVLRVVWLLEQLLGHRGHNRVNRHKDVVASFAPLGELVFAEPRLESAFGCKRLVLIRHLIALFLQCLTSLLLLRELLLLRLAIVAVASVRWCVLIIFAVRTLRLVSPPSRAPGSTAGATLVFLCLCIVFCGGCPAGAPGSRRLRYLRLSLAAGGGLPFVVLDAVLDLLLLLH